MSDLKTAAAPRAEGSTHGVSRPVPARARSQADSTHAAQPQSGSVLGRALQSALGMFGAVFLLGAAAACCGGLPLALVFGAAGAAGLLTGFGVLGLAIFSAASVSLIALRRRRAQSGACRQIGEPPKREKFGVMAPRGSARAPLHDLDSPVEERGAQTPHPVGRGAV